jgi:hypothetical protein
MMKIDLECEFDVEELAAIASHRGKSNVNEADVRAFIREVLNTALGNAIVEYKANQNDPSGSVGS